MDEKYRWTIDLEHDWGGRTNGTLGITEGLPRILTALRKAKVKALFFVSTETLESVSGFIPEILAHGHEIGSHGHFHTIFKERWRSENDRKISEAFLASYKSLSKKTFRYRAPKFNHTVPGDVYSYRDGHVGLLKYTWFGGNIKDDSIFYLHPFDIVRGEDPPNLFCRIWYSKPEVAYENFVNLLNRHH